MITVQDLHEAIAECQGERNPNAQTCIKLAAYYTILNQITEQTPVIPGYASAKEPERDTVSYDSGSEFSAVLNGRAIDEVMPILDELMDTLQLINPRLYDSVLRKLRE